MLRAKPGCTSSRDAAVPQITSSSTATSFVLIVEDGVSRRFASWISSFAHGFSYRTAPLTRSSPLVRKYVPPGPLRYATCPKRPFSVSFSSFVRLPFVFASAFRFHAHLCSSGTAQGTQQGEDRCVARHLLRVLDAHPPTSWFSQSLSMPSLSIPSLSQCPPSIHPSLGDPHSLWIPSLDHSQPVPLQPRSPRGVSSLGGGGRWDRGPGWMDGEGASVGRSKRGAAWIGNGGDVQRLDRIHASCPTNSKGG